MKIYKLVIKVLIRIKRRLTVLLGVHKHVVFFSWLSFDALLFLSNQMLFKTERLFLRNELDGIDYILGPKTRLRNSAFAVSLAVSFLLLFSGSLSGYQSWVKGPIQAWGIGRMGLVWTSASPYLPWGSTIPLKRS